MNIETAPEVLTIEQFAQRMQVSRTTVFAWIKAGFLKEGVHYLRLGRILRLCWREDVFSLNSQQTATGEDEGRSTPQLPNRGTLDSQRGAASVNSPPLTLKREPGPAVNLDYC